MKVAKDLVSCVSFSVTSGSCDLGRRSCRASDSSARWRCFLVIAVIACCATDVTGFLSTVSPRLPTSATAAIADQYARDIYVCGSLRNLRAPELLRSDVSQFSTSIDLRFGFLRQRGVTVRHKKTQARLQRLAASMSGAGSRLQPGRGTQVVLLRHGLSTFNKLNIFTVRETRGVALGHGGLNTRN